LALPLSALLFLGIDGAYEKQKIVFNYVRIKQNGAIMAPIGDIVHQLQRERGLSSIFLNAKGEKGRQELSEQRLDTDRRIAIFNEL